MFVKYKATASEVFGTVIAIKDDRFFNHWCGKCMLNAPLSSKCKKCGYIPSRLQYRLALEVDTDVAILLVTVFGSCLDPYFGQDCHYFYRKIEDGSSGVCLKKLQKYVEEYFVGSIFQFTINCTSDMLQRRNHSTSQLLTSCMKSIGPNDRRSIFESCFNVDDAGHEIDRLHSRPESPLKEESVALVSANDQGHCRCLPVKRRRSISDSFAFLQDSFTRDLLKQCANSQSPRGKSQDAAHLLTNSLHSRTVRRNSYSSGLAFAEVEKKSESVCSFLQSWISPNKIPCDDVDTSYDLPDVTFPALNDLPRGNGQKIPIESPSSVSDIPKLRRCRSLVVDDQDCCQTSTFSNLQQRTSGKTLFSNFSPVPTNVTKTFQASSKIRRELKHTSLPLTSSTPKTVMNASRRMSGLLSVPKRQKIDIDSHISFELFDSFTPNVLRHSQSRVTNTQDKENLISEFNFSSDLFS